MFTVLLEIREHAIYYLTHFGTLIFHMAPTKCVSAEERSNIFILIIFNFQSISLLSEE
jgi:hypothetical protein